jgi:hypothetical protein
MSQPPRLSIGIHEDVPERIYHADPAETPSASSSILKAIVEKSPMHARWAHPRLNPEFVPTPSTEAQERGTILHSMILQTPPPYRVLGYPDYRTKEAQAARDETRAAGLIPILGIRLEPLVEIASALRVKLFDVPEFLEAFETAQREVTLIWEERGSLCRCRVDLLPWEQSCFVLDLKFTSRAARPEEWGRTLGTEYLFQAALYPRAVKALRGDAPEMVFAVCETDPPYGVSFHAMDPQLSDLANRKVDHALDLWRRCMTADEWPGYLTKVHYHEPLPWELARWEAEEYARDY